MKPQLPTTNAPSPPDKHQQPHQTMLLCLSSRDLGEVLLVTFGEVAVVYEASFEV